MMATLRRLGLVRVDQALAAHYVATGWTIRRWLVVCAVVGAFAAAAAVFAWLLQRERARVEALHSQQDKVDRNITVEFDQGGVVCKVPAARENLAPLVHNACQMLTRWIDAEGKKK